MVVSHYVLSKHLELNSDLFTRILSYEVEENRHNTQKLNYF